MKEYEIEIRIGNTRRHFIEGLRSNVETSRFARYIAHLASMTHGEEIVTVIVHKNWKAVSAFDWQFGKCCGILHLESLILSRYD